MKRARPPLDVLRHDPDAARALLARHGIGTNPPLQRMTGWTLGTKPATADLAAALQHTWSAFGVDIAIDVAPSAIDAERVAKGQVPAFRKSWLADYPDAENFLSLFDQHRWARMAPTTPTMRTRRQTACCALRPAPCPARIGRAFFVPWKPMS